MLSQRPLTMPTAFRGDDRAIFRDMMQLWETEPGQFFKQARLHAVEFAGAPPSNAGAFIPQPTVHAWGHGPRQPNPGPRYFFCKELTGKLSEIKTPPAVFAGGSPMSVPFAVYMAVPAPAPGAPPHPVLPSTLAA